MHQPANNFGIAYKERTYDMDKKEKRPCDYDKEVFYTCCGVKALGKSASQRCAACKRADKEAEKLAKELAEARVEARRRASDLAGVH